MNWSKMLKPTRWKVLFSLMPFLIPAFYALMDYMISTDKDIINLDVSIAIQDMGSIIVLYIGYALALPFKSLFTASGLWEKGSFFEPTVPTLGGYISLSIIYSLIIYLTWSLISTKMNLNTQPKT